MRIVATLALALSAGILGLPAQTAANLAWRQNMLNLPGQINGRMSIADVQSFQRNLSMAGPYFAALTPADFEANRVLIGRMWAYAAAMNALAADPSVDPALRGALRNAYGMMAGIPYLAGYQSMFVPGLGQQQQPAPAPVAAPKPGAPPFALAAPEVEGVSAQDKAVARELEDRYDSAAANAAATWQNAETLRMSLAARGMTLNAATAASVARLQLFFEQASTALKARDWDEARQAIQRAEAETAKVAKVVGGK
jgi:hypothetical protein